MFCEKPLTRQAVGKNGQLRFNSPGFVPVNYMFLRSPIDHANGGLEFIIRFRTRLTSSQFLDGVFDVRPNRPISYIFVSGRSHSFFTRSVVWHSKTLSILQKSVHQYTDNPRFVNG